MYQKVERSKYVVIRVIGPTGAAITLATGDPVVGGLGAFYFTIFLWDYVGESYFKRLGLLLVL